MFDAYLNCKFNSNNKKYFKKFIVVYVIYVFCVFYVCCVFTVFYV